MIRDARTSPRTLRGLETYYKGGKTCAELSYIGTVVLLPDTPAHRDSWESSGGQLRLAQAQAVVQAVAQPKLECNLEEGLRTGGWAFRDGKFYSNLRSSAAVGNNKIGEVESEEIVKVVSGAHKGPTYRWYQVRTSGGQEGWVAESGPFLGECKYYFRRFRCTLDSELNQGDQAVVERDPITAYTTSSELDPDYAEAYTLAPGAQVNVASKTTTGTREGTDAILEVMQPGAEVYGWVRETGINERHECTRFISPPGCRDAKLACPRRRIQAPCPN